MADLGALLGAAGVGGTIGQAIVRLELDTSRYQTELKGAEAQTRGFTGLASTAFAAMGVAVAAGLAVSVQAAIEANDAHIKLQNTFKNNPSLADSSVDAFERQADSLRDLTGVDDEAIIRGQALLGQFKLTGAQVQQLTPLIVDLSEKMGIDLEAAAKAVGKATEGNTGALARYVGTIEAGKTPTETYTNILEKLGRVQGFAAESAKAEPWKVIGAQFEEVAEKVGQALLPALQGLAQSLEGILPLLEKVATAVQFVPLVQMGKDFESTGSGFEKFVDAVADTIPVLGHFVNISGDTAAVLETQRGVVGDLSDFYRGQFANAVDSGAAHVRRFAHLSATELKEWSASTKDSFDKFVLSLDETAEQTKITRHEFMDATRVMQREAEQLSSALKTISKEKWVNDDYIKFLSEQGPEWLIGFANLTKQEQQKAQDAWEESTRKTDKAKESLDKITGVLRDLDNGKTKHTVEIFYDYIGFDPSKPGMGRPAGSGPHPNG